MTAAELEAPVHDVVAMRAEVAALLIDLETTSFLVDRVANSHKRHLSFSTHTGRVAMDDAIRAERGGYIRPLGEFAGLAGRVGDRVVPVTSATNTVQKVGQAPVPGHLQALTVDVEVWTSVRQLARLTITHLYRRGVCALHPLPDNADISTVALHMARLLPFIDDPGALQALATGLRAAVTDAGEAAYGSARLAFPHPCPHCRRETLVAYFAHPTNDIDRDLIRCDLDPKTGHYNHCTCSAPLCDCKRRPYSFRHTWYRKPGHAFDTWKSLGQRIGLNVTTKKGPRS